MSSTVRTAKELKLALDSGEQDIVVQGTIVGIPMVTLPPGVTLRGGLLRFGGRGVQVTTNNTLADLRIEVPDTEAAVLTDPTVSTCGTLTLRNVTTSGQVALIGEGNLLSGHVVAQSVHVQTADVRGRFHRPHSYGVDALQGAFTLWNRQPDPSSRLTAELLDLRVGTADAPVRGSGVFIAGTPGGGVVVVSELTTGPVSTDGGIAPDTPDVISGGVFVVTGATVDVVENLGPVTTFGQNDMVLDNWGVVSEWSVRDRVVSRGPSGIGFVNFGDLGTLTVDGIVETFGVGARGFNLYDGTVRNSATFESIRTHGDGAVGIQLSRPLRRLVVRGDLSTSGSIGTSLVKERQTELEAMALSVQAGGSIDELDVGGQINTAGAGVATVEILGGLRRATVRGGIHATGDRSRTVRAAGRVAALDGVDLQPPPPAT